MKHGFSACHPGQRLAYLVLLCPLTLEQQKHHCFDAFSFSTKSFVNTVKTSRGLFSFSGIFFCESTRLFNKVCIIGYIYIQ